LERKFIVQLFKEVEHKAVRNAGLKNEKDYDVLANDKIKIEVKTATLTKPFKKFQHEDIERVLIKFIDIQNP